MREVDPRGGGKLDEFEDDVGAHSLAEFLRMSRRDDPPGQSLAFG
ncbi:hypothetical protein [Brevibacterium antiquum]|nr:hypothetical protein [Brevibacterium antiquum]